MKRARHVKIVATLGPSSEGYDMIRKLYEAGADVFRLNMSHGGHDEIRARHAAIRQVEKDVGRPIAILADLQGPKLRCGTFANGEGYDLGDRRILPFRSRPDARRCAPRPAAPQGNLRRARTRFAAAGQ